jgi:hypothetical protein
VQSAVSIGAEPSFYAAGLPEPGPSPSHQKSTVPDEQTDRGGTISVYVAAKVEPADPAVGLRDKDGVAARVGFVPRISHRIRRASQARRLTTPARRLGWVDGWASVVVEGPP